MEERGPFSSYPVEGEKPRHTLARARDERLFGTHPGLGGEYKPITFLWARPNPGNLLFRVIGRGRARHLTSGFSAPLHLIRASFQPGKGSYCGRVVMMTEPVFELHYYYGSQTTTI